MPEISQITSVLPVVSPVKQTIRDKIGWTISLLVVVLAIFSAFSKFANFEGRDAFFERLGWNQEVMYYIGIMEVIVALFYLVPQTAFIGAILLTAYIGGIIATNVRVNDPFLFPIAIGVLLWIGLALREPRIIALVYDNADSSQ